MLKEFFRFKNRQKGFSLIEMLVSTFVFSVMVGTIAGLFVSGVQGQRSVLAQQKVIDESSYVMEYMSRALRMAAHGDDICVPDGFNYIPSGNSNSITFLNILEENSSGDPECQTFSLSSDGELIKNGIPLTSRNVNIERLLFNVIDNSGQQPKVTISMQIKGVGSRPEQQKVINLQTTVSQRNLNE